MSELAFLTIADASEKIRTKKLSPVEYTKSVLAIRKGVVDSD